jgi:hypothetical protein
MIMTKILLTAAAFAIATALAIVALAHPAAAKIDASRSFSGPMSTVKAPERKVLAQQRCHLDCHDPRQNCRLICR